MRVNWVLGLAFIALSLSATASVSASYTERTFPDGTIWWVFDGEVQTAVRMNSLDRESVEDFGEFVVILKDESELDNLEGLRASARDMTAFLLDTCQSFETPCNVQGRENSFQRKMHVTLAEHTASLPDGRIPENQQVVKALLTWTCLTDCEAFGDLDFHIDLSDPELREQMDAVKHREYNQEVQTYVRSEEGQRVLQAPQSTKRSKNDESLLTAFSKTIDHIDSTQPQGLIQGWLASSETLMIGAWSGSTKECSESLMTFGQDDKGPRVFYWAFDSGIPVPVLSGVWEVSDQTVTMNFQALMTTRRIASVQLIDVAQQLDIIDVNTDSLRLGIPGGQKPQRSWAERLVGSGSILDLLMKDNTERQFVRCDDASIQNGLNAS